jgi:hypothetical protein
MVRFAGRSLCFCLEQLEQLEHGHGCNELERTKVREFGWNSWNMAGGYSDAVPSCKKYLEHVNLFLFIFVPSVPSVPSRKNRKACG